MTINAIVLIALMVFMLAMQVTTIVAIGFVGDMVNDLVNSVERKEE